jgi:hypothetical protein
MSNEYEWRGCCEDLNTNVYSFNLQFLNYIKLLYCDLLISPQSRRIAKVAVALLLLRYVT